MKKMVYGLHAVEALLRHRAYAVEALYCTEKRSELPFLAEQKIASLITLKETAWFSRMLGDVVHQGICAEVQDNTPIDLATHLTHNPPDQTPWSIVVLDRVQDPHNLGAMMRTALAFGASGIVVPKHQSVGLTPAVHKAAVGAAACLPFIQVNNLSQGIAQLKEAGVWCVALDGGTEQSLSEAALERACAFVMGSEGKGVRPKNKKYCDEMVRIPMQGSMQSLNVSVALGITLFAWQQANC